MDEKAKVYALRTFQSKDRTKQYYTMECITVNKQTTPNFTGLNQITVFIDEAQYNKLLQNFSPLMEVKLSASLFGNRVSYSLAS